MKKLFILFLASTFLVLSCSGQDTTEEKAGTQQAQTVQSSQQGLKKQNACDVLSKEQVAQLMKTDVSNLVKEDMTRRENDRRSICYYIVKGELSSYHIKLSWASEKSQAGNMLEKNYVRLLTSEEVNNKNFKEVGKSDHSQTLYSIQKVSNSTTHVLLKRFGNSAEVRIEVIKENEDKALKEELLRIVESLN